MIIPKHIGTVKDGKLIIKNANRFGIWLGHLEGKDIEIIIRKRIKTRTSQQNRALHLYFTQLAMALNEGGYDMKKTIRKDIDIPWTGETIKEYLWRPFQLGYLREKSTTRLSTTDIDKIYEMVNKTVGERTGVHIPFPNAELQMEQEDKRY